MGLFDRWKRKTSTGKTAPQKGQTEAEQLIEIADLITGGDSLTVKEVRACCTDPAQYFQAHRERYEARGISSVEEVARIQWLGLADCLIRYNYACERDDTDQAEDFAWFVGQLDGVKGNNLPVRAYWFDGAQSVPQWWSVLDEKWAPQGFCAGGLDIGRDSYVLFPIKTETLSRLEQLAESAGHRIMGAESQQK